MREGEREKEKKGESLFPLLTLPERDQEKYRKSYRQREKGRYYKERLHGKGKGRRLKEKVFERLSK